MTVFLFRFLALSHFFPDCEGKSVGGEAQHLLPPGYATVLGVVSVELTLLLIVVCHACTVDMQ